MREFVLFVSIAALILVYSNYSHADTKGAIDELRQEQRVKDVFYQEGKAVEWILGVRADGKSQVGFALYACNILHSHNVVHKNTWIRVVDVVKVKNGTGFRDASLGRANCYTWKTKHP